MITYVPPRARTWLLAHPAAPADEAARTLGIAVGSVRTYRHRLIAAGLLDRRGMAAKLRATKDALRDGLTTRAAAKHLGCHPQTISWRLARLDTTAYDTRRDQVYSGREMAAMFGYAPDSAGSYRWLRRLADAGLGPAPRRGRHWRVTAEALMAFLESPASHGLIKIKRISDPDWRAYAEQARAGAFVVPRRKAAQA